jgi:hypothetical protein
MTLLVAVVAVVRAPIWVVQAAQERLVVQPHLIALRHYRVRADMVAQA